ncbi:hypothetical protein FMEXI_2650 [Fusarium mexicanum]|uniref:Uncharacterized protein n=1 Tax=Fusarium mexicanum TaxID=751941 RepID=A0A8H5JCJ9_9HYPO|nr:hypothetical protein FMEXI_2650 [Fusarium mexicanum]
MFARSLSRAAIMAALCLAGLASAVRQSGDPSHAIVSESSSTTTRRAGQAKGGRPGDKVMVPCAGHITQCGVEDQAKVVYVPISTKTITHEIVTTEVVTLPTSTRIIESVRVETVTNTTKGHCRTTQYLPGKPVEVTVDVIVVKTEEIQPIFNTTTWVVSKVTESAIEQCFIPNYTILGQGPGSPGSPEASSTAEATPASSSVASARSSDTVSPAASTPAASDESPSYGEPAQKPMKPMDADDERPALVGSDGDWSE